MGVEKMDVKFTLGMTTWVGVFPIKNTQKGIQQTNFSGCNVTEK